MNSAESSSRPARLPRLGLASRSFGRLWQAPVFVAGLAVFAMVAATAPLRKDPAVVQFEEDVATLRHGIVHEADTPDTLIARAENLLARLPKFTRRSGETLAMLYFTNSFGAACGVLLSGFVEPHVYAGHRIFPVRRTYGDVRPGEYLALVNSFEVVEIAQAEGNAAASLGLSRGAPVVVRDAVRHG